GRRGWGGCGERVERSGEGRRGLAQPGLFNGQRECVQVLRRCRPVVDPLAQQRTAVDDIDGEFAALVFVSEIAPQRIVGIETADRLEGERLQAPGLECVVVVAWTFGVDLNALAKLARMLVKRGFEPAIAQAAASEPLR